jgi:ADP-ribosyl-[dinitrogen reductase] hydrolase
MASPAPLTGLAIGDSLGMPFETASPLSQRLASWTGDYQASSFHHLRPGQYTDDTQMSLAVATAILEHKFYDPAHAAAKYLEWFTSGDCRGIGTSTRLAMANLAKGKEWFASGIDGAEGNGSAMRAAPIGAYQNRGTERLQASAHWARIDAAITHKSDEAKEGSAAMAVATSHLCSGGRKADMLTTVLEHTQKCRLRYAVEDLYRAIRRGDSLGDFLKTREWLLAGVSSHVVQSVPAAFTVFLYSENFEDTVRNAIRMGGDTDSVAAMAGALAGSHYGIEGIPSALKTPLERASDIRAIELRLLGEVK